MVATPQGLSPAQCFRHWVYTLTRCLPKASCSRQSLSPAQCFRHWATPQGQSPKPFRSTQSTSPARLPTLATACLSLWAPLHRDQVHQLPSKPCQHLPVSVGTTPQGLSPAQCFRHWVYTLTRCLPKASCSRQSLSPAQCFRHWVSTPSFTPSFKHMTTGRINQGTVHVSFGCVRRVSPSHARTLDFNRVLRLKPRGGCCICIIHSHEKRASL